MKDIVFKKKKKRNKSPGGMMTCRLTAGDPSFSLFSLLCVVPCLPAAGGGERSG